MKQDTNTLLRRVRAAARDKYAWPGGYPMYVLMADGECLCPDCVKSNYKRISRETRCMDHAETIPFRDREWIAGSTEINYEDQDLYCAHCGEQIESAYGDAQ